MADKEVDIHIKTTGDPKGAQDVVDRLDELQAKADKALAAGKENERGGLGKFLDGVKMKAGAAAKSFGRGAGLFGAIQLVGAGIDRLGGKLGDLADDLEVTGSAGAGTARKLSDAALGLKKFINPIGAYMDAVKRNAEAQKESNRLDRERNKLMAEGRKAAEKLRKSADLEDWAKRNADATEEWADQLERATGKLDFALDKARALSRERLGVIEGQAEEARDRVRGNDSLTDEQKGQRIFAIDQRERQLKEREARAQFEQEERTRRKREEIQKTAFNRAASDVNRLGDAGRGLLSDEERELNKNAITPGGGAANKPFEDALRADTRARERLERFGIGDKKELESRLAEAEARLEDAERELTDVRRERETAGIDERSRRRGARDDFKDAGRDEGRRRRDESAEAAAERQADIDKDAERLAGKVRDLAGDSKVPSKGLVALEKAVSALETDGATGAEVAALDKLLQSWSEYAAKQSEDKGITAAKINQLSAQMAALTKRMNNQRK